MRPIEPMIFRMMTPEQIASGRLDVGRLVVASSEEEAMRLALSGETPVRILSDKEVRKRRLDGRMNKRVEHDEIAAAQRRQAAIERFVKELTGENN